MRWPFTPFGTSTLLACVAGLAGISAVLWWATGSPAVAAAPAPLLLFVLNFFRDPERHAEGGELDLVSPADGLVSDIVQVDDPALGAPCTRIGVFLNVFDVHVNRVPCSAEVVRVEHRAGLCLDARHPRASEQNRAATLVLARPDGRLVAVRQITGLIARRIICPSRVGQRYGRGERYGMIRFGSRTELVLPRAEVAEVHVAVGQRVRGGETLLARLRPAP
ncbi:MAG TPA: phosphatidylserine decarboxylase [Planctomycetota bacterium]|nr:phosphatidylserine decarboxylase [Planctomycetota bacterium]